MGMMTAFKANKAYRLQQKGQADEALRLYEEVYAEGMNEPRYNLAYALLMIRKGEFQKAKEFLVAHQKAPGMTPEQRVTLLVDYAACCFRLGDLDKGISTLEKQYRKTETGLLYQTLGYLYVEKYDAAHRPDFAALEREAAEAAAREAAAADETEEAGEAAETAEPAPALSPEEEWAAGEKKAEEFIRKSLEYDDEDAICLDNMGQYLYRVKGDRAAAREYFEKAHELKDTQIDTLYFLSRYDLEAGNRSGALEKLEKAAEGRFSPLNYCGRQQIADEIARLKGEA